MEDTNIYNELAELEVLKDRVKENQNKVLDMYDTDHEAVGTMNELLVQMNDLLAEMDEVEAEMEDLMKKL